MDKAILSRKWLKNVIKISGLGCAYCAVEFPAETAWTAFAVTAAGVTVAGWKLADWAVAWPHRRNWINPLHAALAGPLGVPLEAQPTKYIKIPRDYTKREDCGRINLPPDFTGVDQATATIVIKNKLGLTDASVTYRLAGRHPHVIIRQVPRPPGKCTWAEYQAVAVASPESAPLMGIGPKGAQVSVDLDSESPHILVNASTGGGKSVITRRLTAQLLHDGAQAVILDVKRHSHKWARGLPQVQYARDVAEVHDALVALGEEGHRRNLIVDQWEGEEGEEPVGPRMVVLLEEANATVAKLKRYWASIREKTDPKESPAIDALREVLFMGRAVKLHVLLVAQSATASALGGPEVRECFATRIMARYTVNAWRMLVPEVWPPPRSTRHIGRAQVVLGGIATETQILFMKPEEAREWASSGIVAPPPELSRVTTFSQVEEVSSVSRDSVTPGLTLITGGRTYNLAEAAREKVVPMSADALRQAKRRDPAFPPADDGRWSAEDLQHWYRNRTA